MRPGLGFASIDSEGNVIDPSAPRPGGIGRFVTDNKGAIIAAAAALALLAVLKVVKQ